MKKHWILRRSFLSTAIFSDKKGAILITTLLLLMLMSLSGLMLLHFAGLEIRLAGNDRLSRALLYRVEACALYGAQTLLNLDSELLSPENPERPLWILDAKDVLGNPNLGLSGKKNLSALADKEFLQLMSRMDEERMLLLERDADFPFLGGGRGKILVVDYGEADSGSQDLGSAILRNYLIFTEYRDTKGQVRYLEMGLRKKL